FLVPFTLPYLLHLLVVASVELDVLAMMGQSAAMIFLPLTAERALFFAWPRLHSCIKQGSQWLIAANLSITSFILMLSAQHVLRENAADFGMILLSAALIVILLYALTLLFFCRAGLETQLIMLTGNLVSNTGLASVLALDYLDGTTLAISIVFGILWNFNLLFLRSWPPLRHCLGAGSSFLRSAMNKHFRGKE
ncbi:MAG: hypothetical protein AAF975_09715, partial [Spirochaetota bacterium]